MKERVCDGSKGRYVKREGKEMRGKRMSHKMRDEEREERGRKRGRQWQLS